MSLQSYPETNYEVGVRLDLKQRSPVKKLLSTTDQDKAHQILTKKLP
ncbi:MAG: hypothetical protein WEA04_01075 [Candidatus Andersenbacteria bacterium]